MLKFLLTILLISSGIRIVTGNGIFMLKSNLEQICFEDEENGEEKAEKKVTKQIAEDNFPVYHLGRFSIIYSGISCRVPLRHHNSYHSFFDQPNTPPPDQA